MAHSLSSICLNFFQPELQCIHFEAAGAGKHGMRRILAFGQADITYYL